MRKKRFVFSNWVHIILLISRLCLIRAGELNHISKQSLKCCGKLSVCLHNTLTRVCLILAPRQDIITTPTAQHWIADEMKLLAKVRCFTLSLSFVLILPALSLKMFMDYIQSLINADLDRKNSNIRS